MKYCDDDLLYKLYVDTFTKLYHAIDPIIKKNEKHLDPLDECVIKNDNITTNILWQFIDSDIVKSLRRKKSDENNR